MQAIPRYRPDAEPELLDELCDRLVGVASHSLEDAEVPEGAQTWWIDQAAAAAAEVLPHVVELVEEAMARRLDERRR